MLSNAKFSGRRGGKIETKETKRRELVLCHRIALRRFVPLLSIVVEALTASHCTPYFNPTAQFTPIPSRSFYYLLGLQCHLGSVRSLHYFIRQYIKPYRMIDIHIYTLTAQRTLCPLYLKTVQRPFQHHIGKTHDPGGL